MISEVASILAQVNITCFAPISSLLSHFIVQVNTTSTFWFHVDRFISWKVLLFELYALLFSLLLPQKPAIRSWASSILKSRRVNLFLAFCRLDEFENIIKTFTNEQFMTNQKIYFHDFFPSLPRLYVTLNWSWRSTVHLHDAAESYLLHCGQLS